MSKGRQPEKPKDILKVQDEEKNVVKSSADEESALTSPVSQCPRDGRTLLKELQCRQGNYICGDCAGDETSWVSKDWGILLCQKCAGIHRGLGTHISKVRSIDLDDWTIEAAQEFLAKGGNDLVNEVLEMRVHKIMPILNTGLLKKFIETKYQDKFEKRKWVMNERVMIYSNSKDHWYSGVISKISSGRMTCVFLSDNAKGTWDCCTKTLPLDSREAKFIQPSETWKVGAVIGIFIRSKQQWLRGEVQKHDHGEDYFEVKAKHGHETIVKRLPKNSYFLRHESGKCTDQLSFSAKMKKGWKKKMKKYGSKFTYTLKNPLARGQNVVSQEDTELCFEVLTQWIEAEQLFAIRPEKLAKIIHQFHGTDKWMKKEMRLKIEEKIKKYTL